MTDFSLNAICINYSNILNNVFLEFFEKFNSSFIFENNTYIFSENISKVKLKKIFKELILNEIDNTLKTFSTNSRNIKVYLIDTCKINNNIIFSETKSDYNISYKLLEDDIYIDLIKFEDIFSEIFKTIKIKNVILLKHKNFSFLQLYNIIEKFFGKNHCKEINICRKYILYDLNNDIAVDKNYLNSIKDIIQFKINEVNEYIKKGLV